MTDLYFVEQGTGEPVLFVHGGCGWGTDHFPRQWALADEYRVMLLDRRGFGDSPATDHPGFRVDTSDILEVLGPGGHLVGLSSGALGCLLAAARSPEAIWSLTVIEPPALGLLRGDPAVESLIAREAACYPAGRTLTPEQFYACMIAAGGEAVALPFDPPPTEKDLAAITSTMREPPSWEADLSLDLVEEAPFPKLVVSGGLQAQSETAREVRDILNRLCDLVGARIGARRVVIPGAGHNSQIEDPDTFNEKLREFLRHASGLRDRASREAWRG